MTPNQKIFVGGFSLEKSLSGMLFLGAHGDRKRCVTEFA